MDRPRYKIRKVLKHLVNPRKAGQRNYLCTSRGVAAWLLTVSETLDNRMS